MRALRLCARSQPYPPFRGESLCLRLPARSARVPTSHVEVKKGGGWKGEGWKGEETLRARQGGAGSGRDGAAAQVREQLAMACPLARTQ
jgi:hypothetical protein